MRLLIVRHAIAMDRVEHGRLQPDDSLRPLTEDGMRKMRRGAGGLAELVDEPDVLYSSPFERARATAMILVESAWPALEVTFRDELKPGQKPERLAALLRERHAAGRSGRGTGDGRGPGPGRGTRPCLAAIVGHEPHLSAVASWFLTGEEKPVFAIKKGGACLLEFSSGVGAGRARLLWLLLPKQLRSLSRR